VGENGEEGSEGGGREEERKKAAVAPEEGVGRRPCRKWERGRRRRVHANGCRMVYVDYCDQSLEGVSSSYVFLGDGVGRKFDNQKYPERPAKIK
jgi:hypothetical protein